MYAGCISGAIQKQVYLELITSTGFTNITIQKEKSILLPDDILLQYFTKQEVDFSAAVTQVFTASLFMQKNLLPKKKPVAHWAVATKLFLFAPTMKL
jgi:arsenite methyltransferase